MIITSDLDRTLIPNGKQEDDGSLKKFYKIIDESKDLILVYATGRNLQMFYEAEQEYQLKKPRFLIASVGTEIFQNVDGKLVVDTDWNDYIREKHPKWDRKKILNDLNAEFDSSDIFLQEENVQNQNKISFYLKNHRENIGQISIIKKYIEENDIQSEVIFSVDPHKDLGLIDILPKGATKLGAVQFLMKKLGVKEDEIVYCGDSGNDILPLTVGIRAVLVKNAPEEIKNMAKKIVQEKGFENKLYIANGDGSGNGNYTSGVIEGLKHFNLI